MGMIITPGGPPQALLGSILLDASAAAVISQSQVAFAPDGFTFASVIPINPIAASLSVSLAAGKSWEQKTVVNVNATNSFTLTGLTGGSYVLAPGTLVTLIYSALSSAWTLAAGTSLPSGNTQTGRTLNFIIDNSGTALATGLAGFLVMSYPATITGYTLIGDQSGSVVIDIWKRNAAVPSVANTITASAKPTLSSAQFGTSTTLTGWTTSVAAGDVFGFNVDSVTSITRLTVALALSAQ